MMSQNQEALIPQLTVGEKINWAFIMGNAILKVQQAIVKVEGEQSEQEVREAVLYLFNIIPTSWKKNDPLVKADLEEAVKTRKVDARNEFCGKRVGKPKFKDEEYIEPFKLLAACINVMDRIGYIGKKNISEISDGTRFDPKKVQEVAVDS